MRSPAILLVLWCLLTGAGRGQLPPAATEPARKWTTTEGQSFQAAVVSYDGKLALFRMANGSRAQAPVEKLGAEDQQYLAGWLKRQPIKIELPDAVGADAAKLKTEVVSEDAAAEKYVYRTEHFELESQGKFSQALLREVARDFEATYELVKVLPWKIEPKPASGAFFKARLLKDRAAYYAAGGLEGSGGIYMTQRETFLVPFESIGVKTVGKSYAKDENFETSTLVHELTHQMMHFWLAYLPQWVVEGTAEYTGTLPLRNGRFRLSAAKNGLKDHIEFLKKRTVSGVPEPYPLEQLFEITDERWTEVLQGNAAMSQRLYFTSYLLVYYFMELESRGDGQLMARYFREVGEVRTEAEAYQKAVGEFKKLPGVFVQADGSYRWSGDLRHPIRPATIASPEARAAFQKKTLAILLNGRTEAELMKQIRSAYVRLGIRL